MPAKNAQSEGSETQVQFVETDTTDDGTPAPIFVCSSRESGGAAWAYQAYEDIARSWLENSINQFGKKLERSISSLVPIVHITTQLYKVFFLKVKNVNISADAGFYLGAGGGVGSSLNYSPQTGRLSRSNYKTYGAGLGGNLGLGVNLSTQPASPFAKVRTVDTSLQGSYGLSLAVTRSVVEGVAGSGETSASGGLGFGPKISAQVSRGRTTTKSSELGSTAPICFAE